MNGYEFAFIAAAGFGVALISGLGLLVASATTEYKAEGSRKPSGAMPSPDGASNLSVNQTLL